MRSLTFTEVERLESIDTAEVALQMDEEAFRAFYERTSRAVWLYLTRISPKQDRVDDLFQETYYRFIRTERVFESEAHRRNYLFRIATNLVHDGYRRPGLPTVQLNESHDSVAHSADESMRAVGRADLGRALASLRPRDRAMLLLAYTEGSSHLEIAETLGVRKSSVKAMLHRARRRLADLLDRGDKVRR
ncbi:MAG TPA: sigma-70 family RNA polymerase sigma factor [Vicinamibacterales bacterium]|jgi:RNA polymerase sigma-70 factor (ECF subfamily)|nr:sigma-70 family RNA polymerase sigma factor [Vicinamibacterales bacterium]